MAKRIVRLTESDLVRLVRKVVKEQMDDDKEPQFADFGMEPIDNTRFDDEEYMTDWENRFKDWVGSGKADEHRKHHGAWMDRQREKKKTKNNTQVTDLGMEPLDKTKFNDKDYMSDWENKFKDWTGKERGKKSMDESEEGGKKLSDEEMRRVLSAVWDSMSAAEKKKIMTKVDKERKEKGLSSLRPKS